MSNKSFTDVIQAALSGDTQKHALDLAAFLEASEMPAELAGDTLWKVDFKGKSVCYIHIDGAANMPGPWTVWPDGDYSSEPAGFAIDEPTEELARAHVNTCGSCGAPCSPGKPATILGKGFDNVCGSVMAFNNPDSAALECLKKMIELRKCAISAEVRGDT